MSQLRPPRLLLGIDTGGTYTDAVIYDETTQTVVAASKAPTTHLDLTIGISAAIDKALDASGCVSSEICGVSISTTLATNAIVEGRHRPVAAVLIGFDDDTVARDGLDTAIASGPLVAIGGGHDAGGREREPLDSETLSAWLVAHRGQFDAAAVTARFAVRDPSHELAAAELIRTLAGVPVTCSHELANRLGGPRRAVTAVLNARLVAVVVDLFDHCRTALADRRIDAPLMVVRGDGSLVSAEFATSRPIETVLSGPAASVVGAAHLSGERDAVVADIGGTTTDVAVLRDGLPTIDDGGARVGGHRTMVRAVAISTVGLGGDSYVGTGNHAGESPLTIGPRRIVPLALAACEEPTTVRDALERMTARTRPNEHDPLLVRRGTGEPADSAGARLLDRLTDRWVAAGDIVTNAAEVRNLWRLVDHGNARVAGFTPTDAALVLGLQAHLDSQASTLGSDLVARRRDQIGRPLADDGRTIAAIVIEELQRRSADVVMASALTDDGFSHSAVGTELYGAGLAQHRRTVRAELGLAVPLIGLGAPAASLYPGVATRLHAALVVPDHAAVANAIGAVVGRVALSRSCTITEPELGVYVVHHPTVLVPLGSLSEARHQATEALKRQVHDDMHAAGADHFELSEDWVERGVDLAGMALLVEGTVTVTATGRPSFR